MIKGKFYICWKRERFAINRQKIFHIFYVYMMDFMISPWGLHTDIYVDSNIHSLTHTQKKSIICGRKNLSLNRAVKVLTTTTHRAERESNLINLYNNFFIVCENFFFLCSSPGLQPRYSVIKASNLLWLLDHHHHRKQHIESNLARRDWCETYHISLQYIKILFFLSIQLCWLAFVHRFMMLCYTWRAVSHSLIIDCIFMFDGREEKRP